MKLAFKLFATLTDYLPDRGQGNSATIDVPDGTTIDAIIDLYRLPRELCHLVLVDGNFIPPGLRATRVLKEGETLAIWPPIAGG